MDEPPDCKYKDICIWYEGKTLWGDGCYEPQCWRALFLDEVISKSKLEEIIKELNIEKFK